MSIIKDRQICILSFSPIARDARVLRQIQFARRTYSVTVLGFGEWSPSWGNVSFISLRQNDTGVPVNFIRPLFLIGGFINPKLWLHFYWADRVHQKAYEHLSQTQYHIIHANDLHALPAAVEASSVTGSKVLFDAHEYSPDQRTDTLKGRLRSPYAYYLLRQFGPRINQLVTVSSGLARLYKELLGLDAEVVMNAPNRVDVQLRPIENGEIHLVHHGNALRGRGLEILIEAMRCLDTRFHLDFILVGEDDRYKRKLNKLADLGVSVEKTVPLVIKPNKFNKKYLKTKQAKMDHKLSF